MLVRDATVSTNAEPQLLPTPPWAVLGLRGDGHSRSLRLGLACGASHLQTAVFYLVRAMIFIFELKTTKTSRSSLKQVVVHKPGMPAAKSPCNLFLPRQRSLSVGKETAPCLFWFPSPQSGVHLGTPGEWGSPPEGIFGTHGELIENTYGLLYALFKTREAHRCYLGRDTGGFMGNIFIIGLKMLNLQRLQ